MRFANIKNHQSALQRFCNNDNRKKIKWHKKCHTNYCVLLFTHIVIIRSYAGLKYVEKLRLLLLLFFCCCWFWLRWRHPQSKLGIDLTMRKWECKKQKSVFLLADDKSDTITFIARSTLFLSTCDRCVRTNASYTHLPHTRTSTTDSKIWRSFYFTY